jgi:hypothetical protein
MLYVCQYLPYGDNVQPRTIDQKAVGLRQISTIATSCLGHYQQNPKPFFFRVLTPRKKPKIVEQRRRRASPMPGRVLFSLRSNIVYSAGLMLFCRRMRWKHTLTILPIRMQYLIVLETQPEKFLGLDTVF